MLRPQKNSELDTASKIVLFLKKKDRPLIANHIAKGIRESSQLVDHHLKRLMDQGVIMVQEDLGSKYYMLQPLFYMRPAETSLMTILIPWIKEAVKEIDTEDASVVRKTLQHYFNVILEETAEETKQYLGKPKESLK